MMATMNDKTSSPDDSVDETRSAEPDTAPVESEASVSSRPEQGPSRATEASSGNRGGGKGLAWLALLLALPGAAFVVFWLLQQPDAAGESADMESMVAEQVEQALVESQERLEAQSGTLANLESRIGNIDERQRTVEEQLDALGNDLAALQRLVDEEDSAEPIWEEAVRDLREEFDQLADSLDARVARFSEQAGEQRELDRELARRLQLMEAAALLQMGQHRLELAADLAGAQRAFKAADAVIQGLDEPRLASLRRELLAELEALESYQQPDWLAMSARLARIADQVQDWPLRPALAEAAGVESTAAEPEEGRMDDLRRSLRQLVQVRPREGLPVDESRVQWVREQVRLRLATIEWGLARRDWTIVEGQMAPLVSLVDEWFEPDAPAVSDFQAAMNELQQQTRPERPPALGAALSTLREQLDRS